MTPEAVREEVERLTRADRMAGCLGDVGWRGVGRYMVQLIQPTIDQTPLELHCISKHPPGVDAVAAPSTTAVFPLPSKEPFDAPRMNVRL